MFSIFSRFDRISSYTLLILRVGVFLYLAGGPKWVGIKRINIFPLIHYGVKEISVIGKSVEIKTLMYTSLFTFVLMINLISMNMYAFCWTTQVSVVLSLSLIIWISSSVFNSTNRFKSFLSHLVPAGTPIALSWFIFLIEVVRQALRPATMMIRLIANIMVGHLVLGFLSTSLFITPGVGILVGLSVMTMVEILVAFLQSYIFFTIASMIVEESH